MKLEALQSLSVVVMFIGLLLSALGGVGAYFFSGGTERVGRQQASAQVESVEPELPIRSAAENSKLAALTEPVPEVSARQLSLNAEPALAPIPEKPPAPTAPVAIAPVAKKSATPEPAPVVAKTTTPAKQAAPVLPPSTPLVAKSTATPAPSPVIAKNPAPEKPPAPVAPAIIPPAVKPSAPAEPARNLAKASAREKFEDLPPVAEKLPEPAAPEKRLASTTTPKKPAAPVVLAKNSAPEVNPPAEAPSRIPQLGIEPWQKEKLLQRLRTFQNGSIGIQVPQGNDDAMGFATALKEAFLTAGWHVTGLTTVKMDRESPGLTLSSGTFPPPTEVTTVFSALVSAGIKLSTELDPAQGKKHAILFVGSRP